MSERRSTARRDEEENDDRRKIPRFSDSELNRTLNQTKLWLNVMYVTSIFIAIFELGYSLSHGLENLTQGFFFGTVFIVMAIILWKCVYTIKLFLGNHSVSNLQRVHEQLSVFFAYIAVLAIIFYTASFFFRF